MDLGLTEDQEMLRSMAREFIEQETPRTFVRDMEEDDRGFTADMWQKIAQVGWLGLIVPDRSEPGRSGHPFGRGWPWRHAGPVLQHSAHNCCHP